jgi:hypothetical protein
MSPNQEQDSPKRVWYASYGSNLQRERFMCYIEGGTPEGSAKRNEGCRDKSEPTESRPISLNFELYFAGRSGTWGGSGGVLLLSRRLSVFVRHIVPFFLEERDCSLTPKGGGAARDEGTLWGDSFQGGPECCPSVLAADQGRRCRQREQERITRKKEWSALRRNCLKKTRRPASELLGTHLSLHRFEQCQAAVRGGRMKRRKFYYKS